MQKLLLALTALALINSATLMAYDDIEMLNFDEPINISGNQRSQRLSASQKLKKIRRYREQQNELYAKKKIEQWRLRQEIQMAKKIKRIFDTQLKALDNI